MFNKRNIYSAVVAKSDKLVEGRLNGWRGVSGETPSTSVGILPQEPTGELNDDVDFSQSLKH